MNSSDCNFNVNGHCKHIYQNRYTSPAYYRTVTKTAVSSLQKISRSDDTKRNCIRWFSRSLNMDLTISEFRVNFKVGIQMWLVRLTKISLAFRHEYGSCCWQSVNRSAIITYGGNRHGLFEVALDDLQKVHGQLVHVHQLVQPEGSQVALPTERPNVAKHPHICVLTHGNGSLMVRHVVLSNKSVKAAFS